MDRVQIQTTQNVALEFEVAGLGDRVLAALIDYFILASYVLGALIVSALINSRAATILLLLPYPLYFLLCEVFLDGQSIGKKLRRIKVARLDGTEPTLANYLIRWLFRLVELDMTSGMVGFVTVLVNGKGQRLGDLAAGTTVVRVQPRIQLRDTILTRLEEDYLPTFPETENLTVADVETAKEVLNTLIAEGRSHNAFLLSERMKTALERKMNVQSDLPPVDFIRTVVKDYNAMKGRL